MEREHVHNRYFCSLEGMTVIGAGILAFSALGCDFWLLQT